MLNGVCGDGNMKSSFPRSHMQQIIRIIQKWFIKTFIILIRVILSPYSQWASLVSYDGIWRKTRPTPAYVCRHGGVWLRLASGFSWWCSCFLNFGFPLRLPSGFFSLLDLILIFFDILFVRILTSNFWSIQYQINARFQPVSLSMCACVGVRGCSRIILHYFNALSLSVNPLVYSRLLGVLVKNFCS